MGLPINKSVYWDVFFVAPMKVYFCAWCWAAFQLKNLFRSTKYCIAYIFFKEGGFMYFLKFDWLPSLIVSKVYGIFLAEFLAF